jgi:K+-transporting ATPase KdpF subunit
VRPALRPAPPRIDLSGHVNLMLYLTAILTVAALIYLGYAMIRPERF